MAQSSDIVLNGDPYMLVAGKPTYQRSQDAMEEGQTGRVMQTDFFGGLGRAIQMENDRGWEGSKAGPALHGQGVQPWPHSTDVTLDAGTPLASSAETFPSALVRDYIYFGVGQYLYRTVTTATLAWATPTMVYDAGAGNQIKGVCYYGGNILLTFGDTKDVTHGVYPGFTAPAVLFAGERGNEIVSYQGYAIWADARAPGTGFGNQLRMVTGTGIQFRWVDGPIKRLNLAGGSVVIGTDTALYTFAGRVAEYTIPNPAAPPDYVEVLRWTGDVNPFFGHGNATTPNDYAFVLGFGGRTYAWIGGMVLEHDPEGDRAGWRDVGLHGLKCHGACVAAGYLVVSITTHDGWSELWAWDGSGWWRIHRETWSGANEWLKPIALAGAGGYDFGVIQNGTRTMKLFRLVWRSATLHHYATSAQYVSSLIDAGERDKQKAWRKIGAVFASPNEPGNIASIDAVGLSLEWSIDGSSYTAPPGIVASANTLPNQHQAITIDLASAAAVSRFLTLKVAWAGVLDWSPILVALWAEYELLDAPARRRRWQFSVKAQDQVIDRDGLQLLRTGREQITELWDHWQNGTTVPFRDLDYDDVATERQVRIVGITERVDRPDQAGKWGDSNVALVLVEV